MYEVTEYKYINMFEFIYRYMCVNIQYTCVYTVFLHFDAIMYYVCVIGSEI